MEFTTSIYARVFDENSPYWTEDIEYNREFLRLQQQYFNDLLRARGYILLNEVYKQLGIPTSESFKSIGWIYDPSNETIDSYIDFGLDYSWRQFELRSALDFNVDGYISINRDLE